METKANYVLIGAFTLLFVKFADTSEARPEVGAR